MTRTRVLQVLTVVAVAVCVVLAIRLLNQPSAVKQAKLGEGTIGVAEAIGRAQGKEVAVTGFLMEGPGWPMRLCSALRRGSPPGCVGPFLYVEALDPNAFNMKKGSDDGRPVRWVGDPVTLLGRLSGTELEARQVLATPR
jgi:hypothetical protein